MSQPIEIPLSKTKLLLLLLGSLAFVAIGFWFILAPPSIEHYHWGNETKMAIAGYASVIFFGLCAVAILRKLPAKGPGLIVDDDGIIDNSSGVSDGRILWSEISGIRVIEIQRQKLILVEVTHPHDHIGRQSSRIKRKLMEMNYKMYGTPLSITSNGLKIPFSELHQLLLERFNESRRKKS